MSNGYGIVAGERDEDGILCARVPKDAQEVLKVMATQRGLSLRALSEMVVSEFLEQNVDKAIDAARRQAEHFRAEAESVRHLLE